jgi:hypothetical protein
MASRATLFLAAKTKPRLIRDGAVPFKKTLAMTKPAEVSWQALGRVLDRA